MAVSVKWLTHASFRIEAPKGNGTGVIYIDPWFNSPNIAHEDTHVERCDIVLCTHAHFDHFEGVPIILQNHYRGHEVQQAKFVGMHELVNHVQKTVEGVSEHQVHGMNKGGTFSTDWVDITMVPADHSSCMGDGTYAGAPVGYVLFFKQSASLLRLYHAGDTNVFSDMKIISDLYKPDLALLPIGGNYTMGPEEAAYALVEFLLSVKTVIPMHYGTFPILAGTPDQLRSALETRSKGVIPEVIELFIGQTIQF